LHQEWGIPLNFLGKNAFNSKTKRCHLPEGFELKHFKHPRAKANTYILNSNRSLADKTT